MLVLFVAAVVGFNYYKDYKAEASDNIMESNSFNPYYIKSEILNY